eukprot:CAMPEP_0170620474 /NCGR_PEP_ID=MMETSP0224-20130122/28077_1 /TAXON_ID=285029 /ORGANISM="Togula jolla, Strain CCCM 725" /LENGTH=393 /DNA_ID=CAMNT_0010946649 /DNA_START=85 /DNA_END=1266 /DNA_ORIENTATION=+
MANSSIQFVLFFSFGVLSLASLGQPTISESEELTFGRSLLHSNLGGVGPDVGEQSLVMSTVTTTKDNRNVDLLISASSNYVGNPRRNGIKDSAFGVINMDSGLSSNFTFRLVDSETNRPTVFDKFYLSFFDLDAGRGPIKEAVTLPNIAKYWLPKHSELKVTASDDHCLHTFKATTKGSGEDNPTRPETLTHLQMNRSFTVLYVNVSEFVVTYTVGGDGGGRNLLFAGWSNLVDHSVAVYPHCATASKVIEAPPIDEADAPLSSATEAPLSTTTEAPSSTTTQAPLSAPSSTTTQAPLSTTTEASSSEGPKAPLSSATGAPPSDAAEAPDSNETEAPCPEASGCDNMNIKIIIECGGEPCENPPNTTVTTVKKVSLLGRYRRHLDVTPHPTAA